MLRALQVATAVLGLTTCAVDLPDIAGRACDETHACRAPRQCVGGLCAEAAEDGGPGGGGAGGAGGTGGAGGGEPLVLPPLWRQSVHGFTGQSVLGSAALEVDTLRGNRVVSTIQNAWDTNDRATANQLDGARLPATGNGRIRGRFQLPSTLALTNNSTFLWLAIGTRPLLQLTFNASGQLVVSSAAGMLGPAAVTSVITWPGGFAPNLDYLLEVSWQRSGYRRVWINALPVAQALDLGGTVGALESPDQLRLGIYRYDGAATSGWAIALFDWQLTDNPSVVLSD